MSTVQFKCPHCNCTRLDEVMTNVTVTSEISSIGEGGDLVYNKDSKDGGFVDRYECTECGYTIKDEFDVPITTSEELFAHLNK